MATKKNTPAPKAKKQSPRLTLPKGCDPAEVTKLLNAIPSSWSTDEVIHLIKADIEGADTIKVPDGMDARQAQKLLDVLAQSDTGEFINLRFTKNIAENKKRLEMDFPNAVKQTGPSGGTVIVAVNELFKLASVGLVLGTQVNDLLTRFDGGMKKSEAGREIAEQDERQEAEATPIVYRLSVIGSLLEHLNTQLTVAKNRIEDLTRSTL